MMKSKGKILLIEDDKNLGIVISDFLEMSDYQVIHKENGQEGLHEFFKTPYDLILLDIMLPLIDGFSVAEEIRKHNCDVPIVFMTARVMKEDRIKGFRIGGDDYITKPFSTKELKVRIRNLINQRNLLRARFKPATIIKPSEITAISIDKIFLERIVTAIEANFENQDFTIESLAAEVAMSVSQLNRKLNALIGQPAGQLMQSLRLQRAAELLRNNAGTVSQISYQLGYSDQSYFSRAFKKQFGSSPGEFIKD